MRSKESIDIENLLIWAYRDQDVVRQLAVSFTPRGPAASPANALAQYLTLGTRVDSSSQAARVLGVRLPDDALIVHDAVLALGDQVIAWLGDDEIDISGRDDLLAAGARIDDTARGIKITWPDGRELFGTMAITSVLLIQHATAASRPDFHADWQPPRGRPADSRSRRWGKRVPELHSYAEVMLGRAQYAVWHAALNVLVHELSGILVDYAPHAPAANEAPWLSARRRILTSVPPVHVRVVA